MNFENYCILKVNKSERKFSTKRSKSWNSKQYILLITQKRMSTDEFLDSYINCWKVHKLISCIRVIFCLLSLLLLSHTVICFQTNDQIIKLFISFHLCNLFLKIALVNSDSIFLRFKWQDDKRNLNSYMHLKL